MSPVGCRDREGRAVLVLVEHNQTKLSKNAGRADGGEYGAIDMTTSAWLFVVCVKAAARLWEPAGVWAALLSAVPCEPAPVSREVPVVQEDGAPSETPEAAPTSQQLSATVVVETVIGEAEFVPEFDESAAEADWAPV
jgi:hypothetical protein